MSRIKILIVEDEVLIAKDIAKTLRALIMSFPGLLTMGMRHLNNSNSST
jgi:hypothetical protein